MVGLLFTGSVFGLLRVLFLRRVKSTPGGVTSAAKGTKDQPQLTVHQLGLLGIKPKIEKSGSESAKKPPKSRHHMGSADVLVPIHQSITGSNRKTRVGSDSSNTSSGNKMGSLGSASKSPVSPSSLYLVPASTSPMPSVQASPGRDQLVSTPWSGKRAALANEITTEEQLEQFLAEIDEKITESAGKLATPPPTVGSFGIASPTNVTSSANASGNTRSTPLRPVRMSPGSQKFTTPPKKGEGDLPRPMSIEESIEAFDQLGIYPQIEQWRDRLRQWFASVLLNPLLNKIETSHIQVLILLSSSFAPIPVILFLELELSFVLSTLPSKYRVLVILASINHSFISVGNIFLLLQDLDLL